MGVDQTNANGGNVNNAIGEGADVVQDVKPKEVEPGRWFVPVVKLNAAETERMRRDLERINLGPRNPWRWWWLARRFVSFFVGVFITLLLMRWFG